MADQTTHVLLIEDEADHAELIRRAFEADAKGTRLTSVSTLREARAILTETLPDLVIADIRLPDGSGMEILAGGEEDALFPVVMFTGHGSEEAAVEAMKRGALDYVVKTESSLADAAHMAWRALREWGHIRERKRMEQLLEQSHAELEQRVRERTAELTAVNEALRREMADRLKAEEAVRAGQELFRTFFELGLVGFAVTSPKRGWLVVNDRLCEMLGYSREELAAMTWDQLTHPEDLSAELDAFEKARCGTLDGGHREKRFIRKDGRILHALVSNKCVRKSDGSLHYVLSVVEDITEQVAAREKIEQLAAVSAVELNKLQAIINNMGEGLLIGDPQGNIVMANPVALALIGYESFQELPKQLAAHYELQEVFDSHGRLLPLEEWPLSRALRGETFSKCELRICRNDTARCWTGSYSGAPVLDASGNVALGIITVRDVSDRKLADDLLARERDNLLNVLEAMQDGVYIVDQEHNIQYLNSALRRIFGPVDGRKCYEYFNERSDACPWCRNAEVFAGKSVRWEWRSPGTGRTYDLAGSPLRNANGTISKLEIVHDITNRKQAEERLQHLQAELAHVDRLKIMGEMATGLAHELNQPLTAILMQAELAGRKLELGRKLDTEELKRTWGQIADQAYRSGQIIRRMRDFVRKSDPVQAPLDFGVLIEELLSLLRSDLRDHEVAIAIDLAAPLPKITADKIQVQQVLLNLARNAIEAMEDTPVERRALGIGARVRGDVLEISVSDTGCGIPAGDSDKLFSAFHSTKSHGMGLGLAISRSIVERHGGCIWAEPNGDRGSIFTITLPIDPTASSASIGPQQNSATPV